MPLRPFLLALVLSGLCASPASAQSNAYENRSCNKTVFSVWDVGDGTEISIKDCGDKTPCGHITKLFDSHLPDANNRDAALRGEPLMGRLMLFGFRESRNGWKHGKIYNPANGKSYKSSIRLGDSDALLVKGCIGPFCEEQTWSRISESACEKE